MSGNNSYVVGVFSYVDTTEKALDLLHEKGIRDYQMYMPTYIEELVEKAEPSPSPVRFVTLAGGILGLTAAIAMTGWMSLDYPLRTSMKPVLSWPAYTIVMFEMTVLIGGLFNLAALFGFSRLLRMKLDPGFDPRFTDDKFGLVIPAEGARANEVKALLEAAGAEEVRDA